MHRIPDIYTSAMGIALRIDARWHGQHWQRLVCDQQRMQRLNPFMAPYLQEGN
jgi:hypothetical protein